jgi:hypothetical protein
MKRVELSLATGFNRRFPYGERFRLIKNRSIHRRPLSFPHPRQTLRQPHHLPLLNQAPSQAPGFSLPLVL